jgi:hypothetical protein
MKPELEITIRKSGHQQYIAIIFVDGKEVWRSPDYHKIPFDALIQALYKEDEKYRIW